jgi:subtilisin-like proprotein convertase family protein
MRLQKILALVVAAGLAAGARAQLTIAFSQPGFSNIPQSGTGGAPGGTSNPANAASITRFVQPAYSVDDLNVEIDLIHSAVGDLRMEVSHCGTTVVLYQQSPASYADLNGVYTFDSDAVSSFSSAIVGTPANGTVPPGTYLPANSLDAFNGMSTAGDWTVTIYDLAANEIGQMLAINLVVTSGQTYTTPWQSASIPDGSNGQCLNPLVRVLNVADHGSIDDVVVGLEITHTYTSDLDITIQHQGVSVFLSQWASPACSGNLGGFYNFWDDGQVGWTTIEAQTSGSAVIPSGLYKPKEPLAAFKGLDKFGPWFLTACDRSANDVGSISQFNVDVIKSPYHLAIVQPNGPASVTLINSGGEPYFGFANLFTLVPGNQPFGWLGGLDIGMDDLLTQLTFGPPFTGTLGTCGSTSVTIPGPIPSNLQVWVVSFQLDPSGSPISVDPVRSYTTP